MAPLRELTEEAILEFITEKVRESKAKGVVIGLSGGVDSAVTSVLCAKAIGPEQVLNLFLPSRTTPAGDRKDVERLCKQFDMELKVVDISAMVDSVKKTLPCSEDKRIVGNATARLRMIALFHHAKMLERVVMGTSNKSELLTGYFTKFGDGGADFCPLGDLYKTEVRELAKKLKIPLQILNKVPTAGLWEGQTDEGEMGISYEELDQILVGMELNLSNEDIASRTKVDLDKVERVWAMHRASVHKRKMPLIPKLGLRTIGLDWRE
ncbi:MAG: NAD+ synthase [Methanomassiliicoccales archaeon]|nr:NAD+ synthase [Methanomassiliicoccales archaeon]